MLFENFKITTLAITNLCVMKVFKILVLISVVLIGSSFSTVHKYYISNTQIDYIKDKKSVQIITRLFIDDLENVLKERYDAALNFDDSPKKTINYFVGKYLVEKFKIKINQKETNLVYLGSAQETGIVKCYLEIEHISQIETIEIANQTLFDLFTEQQNIVKLNINSKKKSFVLTKQNNKAVLNFN